MDINSLYTQDLHDAGAEMQVKDASGQLLDCYITLVGVDSKRWRELVRSNQRKIVEDKGNDTVYILAKASIGWRGFESDGVEVDFSEDRVADLYKNAPYIAEQADRFIANRANFMRS